MSYGRNAKFEEIREIAFGSIGAGYTAVGAKTTDYTRLFTITNETNEAVYVSFNGIVDHLRLVSGETKMFNLTANKVRDDGLFLPKGTLFYVKDGGSAPISGLVAIEVMYASGGI